MAGRGSGLVLAPVRPGRAHAPPGAAAATRGGVRRHRRLVDGGVHDPGTMPFFVPWTDLAPVQRARETAQWLWGHRANWIPDKWTFTARRVRRRAAGGHAGRGGRAFRGRALGRDGLVAGPGPPGPGPGAGDARGDPAPGLRRPRCARRPSAAPSRTTWPPSPRRARSATSENGEARGAAARRLGPHGPLPDGSRRLGAAAPRRHRDRRARRLPRHVRRPATGDVSR